MTNTNTTAQVIEDCAGAWYSWFEKVEVRGTKLYVKVDESQREEGEDFRIEATLSATELRTAAQALLASDAYGEYEDRFLRDLLARRWDDVDGDQNIVDSLVQQAMWGTVIFG